MVDPWPAQVLALGARPSYSCDHSLADQISLKLGEDREHPEQRLAARRRRVDGLVQDDELDAQGPEPLAEGDEVPDRAGEPIELRAHHDVDFAPTDGL